MENLMLDVWNHICEHLSVKDTASVRFVCKALVKASFAGQEVKVRKGVFPPKENIVLNALETGHVNTIVKISTNRMDFDYRHLTHLYLQDTPFDLSLIKLQEGIFKRCTLTNVAKYFDNNTLIALDCSFEDYCDDDVYIKGCKVYCRAKCEFVTIDWCFSASDEDCEFGLIHGKYMMRYPSGFSPNLSSDPFA